MTWVKVDDLITEHEKCVGLSADAWCLWLHGLTYCSRNLTDGRIPKAMLPRLTNLAKPAKAAAELVEAGLWDERAKWFAVHDYLEHQRSKAQVEADREAAAERQRRARERRSQEKSQRESRGVSQRDMGVSHGSVTRLETESETDVTTPLPPFVVDTSVDNRSRSHGHYPYDDRAALHPAVAALHASLASFPGTATNGGPS
jgi:hypothetical protein